MSRDLIEREALAERAVELYPYKNAKYIPLWALKEAPTIDAVEVIRCGECVFYRPQNQSVHWEHMVRYCMRNAATKVLPNDYCSRGKRKEGTDEKRKGE